jgi:hypothetical protein
MEMKMFAITEKAKSGTENIKRLNLSAVRHATVQVASLPL